LGHHFNLTSQLFVSPKSKDKQGFTVKLLQPVQKFQDNGGITGILTTISYATTDRIASVNIIKENSSFHHEDIIPGNLSLRAPPTV
jgi:hypothetical protein